MNFVSGFPLDFLGSILGFVLTLMVFSYFFGDNGLFRLAVHILVGVSSAFVVVVAWYNVIAPQLVYPFIAGPSSERGILLIPLIMSLLLMAKAFPRISMLGTPVMAFLVGVGAATAIGGAVLGTMMPQLQATIAPMDWRTVDLNVGSSGIWFFNGLVFLVGVISVLSYFHFSVSSRRNTQDDRSPVLKSLAYVGQIFVTISMGVLFAGVLLSTMAAFVERWRFIFSFFRSLWAG